MWQQWKTELQWTEHLMEVEEVEGGVEEGVEDVEGVEEGVGGVEDVESVEGGTEKGEREEKQRRIRRRKAKCLEKE